MNMQIRNLNNGQHFVNYLVAAPHARNRIPVQ
jgi:aspartate 1-decarboxylase